MGKNKRLWDFLRGNSASFLTARQGQSSLMYRQSQRLLFRPYDNTDSAFTSEFMFTQ